MNHEERDAEDDQSTIVMEAVIKYLIRRRREPKRRKKTVTMAGPRPKRRGGKVGRRWTQQRKGELKPERFAWWRLIQHDDVHDIKSRRDKVSF